MYSSAKDKAKLALQVLDNSLGSADAPMRINDLEAAKAYLEDAIESFRRERNSDQGKDEVGTPGASGNREQGELSK